MTELASYPDVYFTPGYGAAARDGDFESWCSIHRFDGRWQMPLVVRRAPGDVRDAASPYGYSGVFADPQLTTAQLEQAWDSTIAELRDRGLVSVFLRHSPLVPQAPAHEAQIALVTDHPTVSVRVQAPDRMWAALEGRCRTAVRKATNAGMTAVVRVAEPEDVAAGSAFRSLYESTMRSRGAGLFYFFDDGYYGRLSSALGGGLLVAEVRTADGRVVAACLLMAHGRYLHYHLSGSDPEAARSGANNLMLWQVCRFAAVNGIEVFHLGGGLRAGDPLHRFKRSFGGGRGTYRTTGLILDTVRYARLCSAARSAEGFFPAYRGAAR